MCKIASHVLVSAPDIMFCLKSIHSRFFFKIQGKQVLCALCSRWHSHKKTCGLAFTCSLCHFFLTYALSPGVASIQRYTIHGACLVKGDLHVGWNEAY